MPNLALHNIFLHSFFPLTSN